MTYLEMCQAAYRLIGELDTLSSVLTATGFQKVVCLTVKEAWLDIQRERRDFDFMRSNITVNISDASQTYDPVTDFLLTDFGYWDTDMILYDDRPLTYYSYDRFLTVEHPIGAPAEFCVIPNSKYLYFNELDATYSITAHYFTSPEELTTNTQEPSVESSFHYAIVYRAVYELAITLGEASLEQHYRLKYNQILGQLFRAEVPPRLVKKRPIA